MEMKYNPKLDSVVFGIIFGRLYNYYHHPIFLLGAIVEAIMFFLTFSYFSSMCVRLFQDWQAR